jgi:hypothetical protein
VVGALVPSLQLALSGALIACARISTAPGRLHRGRKAEAHGGAQAAAQATTQATTQALASATAHATTQASAQATQAAVPPIAQTTNSSGTIQRVDRIVCVKHA